MVPNMLPSVGIKAPNFTLPDQHGVSHTLSSYEGQWVLLYFYPKDATPGCTTEAQVIRDAWTEFSDLNIAVLGVSADSISSHKKFADKQELPFPLLSDEAREVVAAYGVWGKKKMMGREYDGITRTSFLIDPQGTVTKVYEGVKPALHAAEVLEDVRAHA